MTETIIRGYFNVSGGKPPSDITSFQSIVQSDFQNAAYSAQQNWSIRVDNVGRGPAECHPANAIRHAKINAPTEYVGPWHSTSRGGAVPKASPPYFYDRQWP
jgi:hypothetical protein